MIRTPRLRLEPLNPRHADELFQGLNDERLYEYIPERSPVDAASLRARYTRLAEGRSPDGRQRWLNWAVRPCETGEVVGYVQATVEPDCTASLGYVLIHDAWGRGYAREAVDAVVQHLLASGVTDVLAYVDPRNERSLVLLDRLGFARAGEEDGDVVFSRR